MDSLCFTDGCREAYLGTDRFCLQVGEGKCVLRASEGIYIEAPSVTVRAPLAVNQYRTGKKGKGRRNPVTGGGRTSIQSQYEFSVSSPLGELIGTVYEEYNPFKNDILYESYEAVEKRRREGLLLGILAALAVGAVVTIIVVTGGAALSVALTVGAVIAGIGSLASAVTYIQDKQNSTASEKGTYIKNAGSAALIMALIIGSFWALPYEAEILSLEVTNGLPLTMLFGEVFTYGEIYDLMMLGTEGVTLLNTFFQISELEMFFSGKKALGKATGNEIYDGTKEVLEITTQTLFLMAVEYWFKTKENSPAIESQNPKEKLQKPATGSIVRRHIMGGASRTLLSRKHLSDCAASVLAVSSRRNDRRLS